MKKILFASTLIILFVLSACKTDTHILKCPDISSIKPHHELWVKAHQRGEHNTIARRNDGNNRAEVREKDAALATTAKDDSSVQIKIPRIAIGKLDEKELSSVNEAFVKYSNNKIQLERKENGRMYLKADSRKDFLGLVKTLVALKKSEPAALAAPGGGGIALAAGIIGIVAIVFALGPFISYGAFLLGVVAIILGAIGLHSSRRGWAILGIVLGVLAIVFAGVLGIGIYTLVLHI